MERPFLLEPYRKYPFAFPYFVVFIFIHLSCSLTDYLSIVSWVNTTMFQTGREF
jgi:hypothetical protein